MSHQVKDEDKKSNIIVLIVKNITVFRAKPRCKGLARNLQYFMAIFF